MARGKRQRNEIGESSRQAESAPVIAEFENHYPNEEVKRYRMRIAGRTKHPERSIVTRIKNMRRIIRHLGLRGFYDPRAVGKVWVIEEFYASGVVEHVRRTQARSLNNFTTITIRGCKVDFTVERIRKVLGLTRPELCEYHDGIERWGDPKVSRDVITPVIAVKGAVWFDNGRYLSPRYLKRKAVVLYEMVCDDILPTTNTTQITWLRPFLVYLMMLEKKIDFGKIIHNAILARIRKFGNEYSPGTYTTRRREPSQKPKEPLFLFPSLVSHLCLLAGVPLLPDEPETPESSPITYPLPERPPLPPPQPQPVRANRRGTVTNAAISEKLDIMMGTLDTLTHSMESIARRVVRLEDHFLGGDTASHTHAPAPPFHSEPRFVDEHMIEHTEPRDDRTGFGDGIRLSGASDDYLGSGTGTILVGTTEIVGD